MVRVRGLKARQVYNSRGEETIEVEVEAEGGWGRAAAPAGASKGAKEVAYYPSGGVQEAVRLVNQELSEKLKGLDISRPEALDQELSKIDGTESLTRIGGNTAYAVGLASALAASSALGKPLYRHLASTQDPRLPYPLGNVIGGGKHAGKGAPDWQELLVIPVGARDVREAVRANIMVHRLVGRLLDRHLGGFTMGRGDEGAYAPPISTEKGLEILSEAVGRVSDELGFEIRVGADVAASSLWDPERRVYRYPGEGVELGREEQMERVSEWVDRFRLYYVEDPLEEDDMEGFAELNKAVGNKTLICGDDLIVTQPRILREAAEMKAVGAVIIKPNQVGLITRAMEATELALSRGIVPVVSHRSGEPPEGHLSHLAVAWGGKILKAGVLGGERVAKANELLRIGEEIGFGRMAGLP